MAGRTRILGTLRFTTTICMTGGYGASRHLHTLGRWSGGSVSITTCCTMVLEQVAILTRALHCVPIATSALLLFMAVAASNRTCLSLPRLRLLPHLLSDQVSIKTMALLEARLLVITCCSTRCLILATTATSTGQSHNNLLFHDPVQMQFFLLTA